MKARVDTLGARVHMYVHALDERFKFLDPFLSSSL